MRRKLVIIFSAYYLLMIISACGDCQNFNTEIVDIRFLPTNTFIAVNDILEFNLITDEVIVANQKIFDFKLIESAYAFGCDDTFNPIKWINNINVTANQDYSNQLPAGASLNELVDVEYFNGSEMTNVNANLNEYIQFVNQIGDGGKSDFSFETFRINERPTSNQNLRLRFEFTFTDNSNFILETEPIIWE